MTRVRCTAPGRHRDAVSAGHAGLAGLAVTRNETGQVLSHLDAAVTAGYNDCVALHMAALRPLHGDPRFRSCTSG
ncbi:hypothetical protein [Streptomyces sp. NPDC058751]|uniref:hypothetical protein n=1 Tax=Streptomyces sp. NPDC058751 TaxID=3346623 RepID=UPI003685A111